MKKNNIFLKSIVMISMVFLLYSCSFKLENIVSDDIILVNGSTDYDKNTVYLRAKNPENLPENANNRKDTLVIGMKVPEGVFNPLFSTSGYDFEVVDQIFSKLLEIDYNGFIIEGLSSMPNIFKEEDKYVFRFNLKDNLKWQDGTTLTSEDFEFTFKVLMDKTYNGTFERDALDMFNWEEYRDGKTENLDGFRIIDDKTFDIILDSVNGKTMMYFERIRPLAKHIYGDGYIQGNAQELNKFNKTPFGNGPYKLSNYKEGEEVYLVSNEYYYKGEPEIKNLVIKFINDTNQMILLENGELDIIRKNVIANDENMKLLNELGFVNAALTDYLGFSYIAINHNEENMQDKNIRKALVYGLDRKKITDLVYGDYAKVIDIPQVDSSWAYPEEGEFTTYSYDKNKAIKLLEESGWLLGKDGIREKNGEQLILKFLASSPNEVNNILVPIMIENYKDIGIKVVAEQMEFQTLLQKQREAKEGLYSYDLAFLSSPFSNSDPDASTRFKTGGTANRISYSNDDVDRLLDEGVKETNIEKRKDIYNELYKVMSEDVPSIFLFQRKNVDVYSSRVKGVEPTSLYRGMSNDIYKYYLE